MTDEASQGQLFMSDPEVRESSAAARLARLPIPTQPLRGKKRIPSEMADPRVEPKLLPNDVIQQLGRLLQEEDALVDDITRYGRPSPSAEAIGAYVMGANSRNKRKGNTPEERHDINQARRRQSQRVADKLQRELRSKTNTARIYRAALSSVQASVARDAPLNETASLYAAAALEDFGICLREKPEVLEATGFDGDIAGTIEHMGVYAVDHPESLRRQPDALRLVQIEQAKREETVWSPILEADLASDRDRSTQADREAQANVEALIASFTSAVEV